LSTSTSEKTHTINITSDMIGKTLRISLAYLKHHSHNLPNVNLSLESSSGMSVNRSESLANNVEIMEYVPTSAGVYTIIVEKLVYILTVTYITALLGTILTDKSQIFYR